MKIKLKIDSNSFQERVKKVIDDVGKASGCALYDASDVIMQHGSMMATVDTRQMVESAYITKPIKSGSYHVVEMGFGRVEAPEDEYMILMHEDPGIKHSNGMAFFLGRAVSKHLSILLNNIATYLQRRLITGNFIIKAYLQHKPTYFGGNPYNRLPSSLPEEAYWARRERAKMATELEEKNSG